MREVTASGQSVDEAVESALRQLGATRDSVEVNVIDEGKKGFLGLFGSKLSIVSVRLVKNSIEETEKFIKELTRNMNVDIKLVTTVRENHVTFDMSGKKIALLIGKRGQTLNALQYLIQLAINKDSEKYFRVTLDAEGYRKRRKETLEALAMKMAEKAKRIGKNVALEPMPAYERKIIHSVLQQRRDVKTYSDGVEPHRYVVVKP